MVVCELRPVDTADPNWQASTYQRAVVIRAADEDRARIVAQGTFGIAVPRGRPGQDVAYCPWRHADLVTCTIRDDDEFDADGPEAILEPAEYDYEWRVRQEE